MKKKGIIVTVAIVVWTVISIIYNKAAQASPISEEAEVASLATALASGVFFNVLLFATEGKKIAGFIKRLVESDWLPGGDGEAENHE